MTNFADLTIDGRVATPATPTGTKRVVGYTLGGGLSWLGRRHGFACNKVRAIELVTGRRRAAEQPVPALGNHATIRELPDEAIEAFVAYAGPESGSPLLLAELRQLGGALARPSEGGGALDKIDAAFVMLGIGLPMTPELGEAVGAHLDRMPEAMGPWAAEGGYFNFAERPCDADAILPAETCSRLAEVKRRYDPENRIVANHAVSLDLA